MISLEHKGAMRFSPETSLPGIEPSISGIRAHQPTEDALMVVIHEQQKQAGSSGFILSMEDTQEITDGYISARNVHEIAEHNIQELEEERERLLEQLNDAKENKYFNKTRVIRALNTNEQHIIAQQQSAIKSNEKLPQPLREKHIFFHDGPFREEQGEQI